jgi:hypothetical protein
MTEQEEKELYFSLDEKGQEKFLEERDGFFVYEDEEGATIVFNKEFKRRIEEINSEDIPIEQKVNNILNDIITNQIKEEKENATKKERSSEETEG